jgi:asparagine synthase (glutamine-hydrolysing)
MCGITGFLDALGQRSPDEMAATVERMANTLRHRGPDDSGTWVDADSGIALGHRRLSIVDLSPEGHQPMESACGRYVIGFNGEVYNFHLLRKELEAELGTRAPRWRGHSDTEVMLEAISRWGVESAVKRFNGMFACALWDRKERLLYLIRDRLGKKPLYYGWMGGACLFGSELKALRAHPFFRPEIDRGVLALYLRHNYVPAPYSIYKGIFKVPQGAILTIDGSQPCAVPAATCYWSVKEVAERGTLSPVSGSMEDATAELDALLQDAVRLRMVADVPLGAFLSGGIDSSAIVALMQAQSERPVRTFTIGFWEKTHNEAEYAKAVAQHLGTDHTELYVTPQQALDVIPRLPDLFDEPFSDSSQIPMFLVAEMARRDVTVSLSGDGGDELFFGYPRYFKGRNIWDRVEWMPLAERQFLANAAARLPARYLDALLKKMPILSSRLEGRNPFGGKLSSIVEILSMESEEAFYRRLVSHWKDPISMVSGANELPTVFTDRCRKARLPSFSHEMMYMDSVAYLPDDILVKVDRASMGASLEARAPLLDHRVVEFAWRLPMWMRARGMEGKLILRNVLNQYVPREMIERPKMGFGVPIHEWLRGPLKEWAESLLDEKRLREEGFFNPAPIREKWLEHLSGRRNWQYYLWDVLMFQAWLERWG